MISSNDFLSGVVYLRDLRELFIKLSELSVETVNDIQKEFYAVSDQIIEKKDPSLSEKKDLVLKHEEVLLKAQELYNIVNNLRNNDLFRKIQERCEYFLTK